jgi:hypothetical protein
LARRLIGYFNGSHTNVGKFIPLLKKESIESFSLQVILMPLDNNYFEDIELCLEQYFLLRHRREFNLNTLRLINKISGSRAKPLYIYTKDDTKLIYRADNQEEVIFGLNIHYNTINHSISSGEAYLGKYLFCDKPKYVASVGIHVDELLLSLSELRILIERDRLEELGNNGRKVIIKSKVEDSSLTFNSISECLV